MSTSETLSRFAAFSAMSAVAESQPVPKPLVVFSVQALSLIFTTSLLPIPRQLP